MYNTCITFCDLHLNSTFVKSFKYDLSHNFLNEIIVPNKKENIFFKYEKCETTQCIIKISHK